VGVLVSLGVGSFVVAADYLAVAPNGTDLLKSAATLLIFPFLLVLIAMPTALLCCFSTKLRKQAIQVFFASLIFALIYIIALQVGRRIRMNGFRELAERSAPLVDAIKSYVQTHGSPPPDLDALVPNFLSSIPETGMAAYPEYYYRVAEDRLYWGNTWVLNVFCTSGPMNFDSFVYYPNQNYGFHGEDLAEMIGDWAYLVD